MRARAIDCLNQAGIPWRVVFVSHSLSGIWAAVQAGLGVTLRTRIGMPGNLRVAESVLPAPGSLGITLEQKSGSTAQTKLEQLMEEALHRAM